MKKHLTFVLLLLSASLLRAADGSSMNSKIYPVASDPVIRQYIHMVNMTYSPALAIVPNTPLAQKEIKGKPSINARLLSFSIMAESNDQTFYGVKIRRCWLV
ncbi:MAG: hypothetical protein V4714_05010 [Bacteroidota bacterium]